MTDTFASLNAKLSKLQLELTDDRLMHDIGKMAKKEATSAASADLGGDPKFSGWAPKLDTRYKLLGPGRLSFAPTRRSAGPWTVAQYGRNQMAGPTVRTSSIGTSGRKKRAGVRYRRWNGQTAGKGTADKALARIEPQVPKLTQTQISRAVKRAGLT